MHYFWKGMQGEAKGNILSWQVVRVSALLLKRFILQINLRLWNSLATNVLVGSHRNIFKKKRCMELLGKWMKIPSPKYRTSLCATIKWSCCFQFPVSGRVTLISIIRTQDRFKRKGKVLWFLDLLNHISNNSGRYAVLLINVSVNVSMFKLITCDQQKRALPTQRCAICNGTLKAHYRSCKGISSSKYRHSHICLSKCHHLFIPAVTLPQSLLCARDWDR